MGKPSRISLVYGCRPWFAGAVIVHDDVNVEIKGPVLLDLIEKPAAFPGTMPVHAWADRRARLHVERSERRRRAMALVIVGALPDLPRGTLPNFAAVAFSMGGTGCMRSRA